MKLTIIALLASIALTASASSALAYGRGVRRGGVAPVRPVQPVRPGGGVAAGPYGAVHPVSPVRPVGVGGGTAVGTRNIAGGGTPIGTRNIVGGGTPIGTRNIVGGGAAVGTRNIAGGGAAIGTRNIAGVGHRTNYVSSSVVRNNARSVRAVNYPYFTPAWNAARPGRWVAPRWVPNYNLWRPVTWAILNPYLGINYTPMVYDYGTNVVVDGNYVYRNGDTLGTADAYASQASQAMETGRQAKLADSDEWQPLGVFGVVYEDEQKAQNVFQLAVNKDGIVRGNYYDAISDTTLPVAGSVNKKTQRVAWSYGDRKDLVFETGLANFTKPESTLLVHFGKENTQQMLLVRLDEPKDQPK